MRTCGAQLTICLPECLKEKARLLLDEPLDATLAQAKSSRVDMEKRLSCLARSQLLKATPGHMRRESGDIRVEAWLSTRDPSSVSQEESQREQDAQGSLEMRMKNTRWRHETMLWDSKKREDRCKRETEKQVRPGECGDLGVDTVVKDV